MSYLVFARKFRPQTFDEVVGQEPITTTLKNAISKKRIAQSFLFTGSRGVGKTSTARIFAKALNCEKGPAAEPCNKCSVCDEITQGISLDVLEIDGASNRGIDEIRSLRENVKFKPARSRYKVYIIDEVHMLTGEAFNALLKTLEEPPEHVKFIFATTEAHKVPLTILSRCQRFNFRRIPTDEVAKKLKEIAKKEKIKIGDAALYLVAKSAEGSLRDGESLLDQLASFGEGEVSEKDVTFTLGLTAEDVYFTILNALKERDAKSLLRTVADIADEGKDLNQFAKGLAELFRNLLVLKVGEKVDGLIEGTEDLLAKLKKYKDDFTREELLFALTLLQQLGRDVRWSGSPRFIIEACLLKIASRSNLKAIDEILKELKTLGSKQVLNTGTMNQDPLPQRPQTTRSFEAEPPFPAKKSIDEKKKENFEVKSKTVSALSSAETQTAVLEPKRQSAKESSVTLNDIGRVWPDLVERIKSVKMSCGTYLSESEPVEVTDGIAVFGFPAEFKFHKEALEKQDNKDLIRNTLVSLLGEPIGVAFVVTTAAKTVTTEKTQQPAQTAQPAGGKESDIITSALNIFESGKVVYRDI